MKKIVKSPFFNENEKVTTLFNEISKEFPHFKHKKLEKEVLSKKVYKNMPYKDLRMRHLMADLLRIVEEFIAYKAYKERKYEVELNLIQSYRTRKLNKHLEKVIAKVQKDFNAEKDKIAHHYHVNYRLETEIYAQLTESLDRSAQTNLQSALNSLDIFYLINKLKYICLALDYKSTFNSDIEITLFDEIKSHMAENDYSEIPVLKIYYLIFLCLTEPEKESYFNKLLRQVNIHLKAFTDTEAKEIFTFTQNYCIRKINEGNQGFLKVCFFLYKKGIREKIIFNTKDEAPWKYKNIVVIGLKLKEFEWVEKFLEHYKENITESERENAYTFNLAKIKFHQKDFQSVTTLLNKVEYTDLFYVLDSKTMLIMTYYEIGEYGLLMSLLDSFQIFMSRKKTIKTSHKSLYTSFVKFTRRLVNNMNKSTARKISLRDEINESNEITQTNRVWLVEKINKLIPEELS